MFVRLGNRRMRRITTVTSSEALGPVAQASGMFPSMFMPSEIVRFQYNVPKINAE